MATIRDLVGGAVDFGRHSDDYAQQRPGFPPVFYDRLETLLPLRGARDRAEARGIAASCRFAVAPAETTGEPDASFDLVTAGTCWHWFDHIRALAECARVLVPSGLLAIANYTYLPQHSELVRESEALVVKWNPNWKLAGFNGLFPWLVDLVSADPAIRLREQFCFDHAQAMTHAGWRGRLRTCNGVGSGGVDDATVE